MPYAIAEYTPPPHEPATLDELRTYLRIDGDEHDAQLSGTLAAARETIEAQANRVLVPAVFEYLIDALPSGCRPMLLPRGPLLDVLAIEYTTPAGPVATWPAEQYTVDTHGGRIVPAFGHTWPSSRRQANGHRVRIVCGYGVPFTADTAANALMPERMKFRTGDVVQLTNCDGALPAGLSDQAAYHVVNRTGNTIQLAGEMLGEAIDITDPGTGRHYIDDVPHALRIAVLMLAAHWFQNAEGAAAQAMPPAVQRLIDQAHPGDDFEWYG